MMNTFIFRLFARKLLQSVFAFILWWDCPECVIVVVAVWRERPLPNNWTVNSLHLSLANRPCLQCCLRTIAMQMQCCTKCHCTSICFTVTRNSAVKHKSTRANISSVCVFSRLAMFLDQNLLHYTSSCSIELTKRCLCRRRLCHTWGRTDRRTDAQTDWK